MSIDLTQITSTLSNASIQYTYPEMDIRNITTNNTVKKFLFRNGMSGSSFSFTDASNSIFKSGIATEGTIGTGIHTGNSYELTIKHISSTGSDYFFVVFPIESGGESSFIDTIISTSSTEFDIINVDATNKSLNAMISKKGDIYKYDIDGGNNDGKSVFVFKTPIKTSNDLKSITNTHGYWPDVKNIKIIKDNDKITEEIVCDYTGEELSENVETPNSIKYLAKIGYTTLIFGVLVLYVSFFYGLSIFTGSDYRNWWFAGVIILSIFLVGGFFGGLFGKSYNSNKLLSMYTNLEAIPLFFGALLPLDAAIRSVLFVVFYILNKIIGIDIGLDSFSNITKFLTGYLYSSTTQLTVEAADIDAMKKRFANYTIVGLSITWIISVITIMTK
jgi:hypothetical protein